MGQAKAKRAAVEAARAADTRCPDVRPGTSYVRCESERGHNGPHVFVCPEWFDYQVGCVLLAGHDGPHRFEWEA